MLDEDIYYMNYDVAQTGVDALPSKTELQYAVTEWARDMMNAKPANLYIIWVDHGFTDTFLMYPEEITPQELDTWLDDLQGRA